MKKSFNQKALCALTCFSLLGLPSAGIAKTSYSIKQSNKLSGPQTISLTDDAVKIVQQNTGITYMCKRPNWRWQIFNARTHKLYECAPEAFKGGGGQAMVLYLHERLSPASFKKLPSTKIMNEPTERLCSPLSSFGAPAAELKGAEQKRFFEICFLHNDSLPHAVKEAIGRVHGIPLAGVPLDASYIDEFNSLRKALLTIRLDRNTLGPDCFALPKDCTSVKSEKDVFNDEELNSDVTQLLGPK